MSKVVVVIGSEKIGLMSELAAQLKDIGVEVVSSDDINRVESLKHNFGKSEFVLSAREPIPEFIIDEERVDRPYFRQFEKKSKKKRCVGFTR